jgi:transposase
MIQADEARRVRRWRSIAEKRQIVQLTLEPGASVAEVARAHGVNANQVFKWRRAFERGELNEPCSALLPVSVAGVTEPESGPAAEELQAAAAAGSIHIELPGIAMISVESGADSVLVRQILESLRK